MLESELRATEPLTSEPSRCSNVTPVAVSRTGAAGFGAGLRARAGAFRVADGFFAGAFFFDCGCAAVGMRTRSKATSNVLAEDNFIEFESTLSAPRLCNIGATENSHSARRPIAKLDRNGQPPD